jgi:hypothetical protein
MHKIMTYPMRKAKAKGIALLVYFTCQFCSDEITSMRLRNTSTTCINRLYDSLSFKQFQKKGKIIRRDGCQSSHYYWI